MVVARDVPARAWTEQAARAAALSFAENVSSRSRRRRPLKVEMDALAFTHFQRCADADPMGDSGELNVDGTGAAARVLALVSRRKTASSTSKRSPADRQVELFPVVASSAPTRLSRIWVVSVTPLVAWATPSDAQKVVDRTLRSAWVAAELEAEAAETRRLYGSMSAAAGWARVNEDVGAWTPEAFDVRWEEFLCRVRPRAGFYSGQS